MYTDVAIYTHIWHSIPSIYTHTKHTALYIRIYDIWQNSTQGAFLSPNDVAVTSLKIGPCETLSTVPIWEVYSRHHCQDSEAIIHLETNKHAPWFNPCGRLLRRGCNSFFPVLFTTWHLEPTEYSRDTVVNTGNGLAQGTLFLFVNHPLEMKTNQNQVPQPNSAQSH